MTAPREKRWLSIPGLSGGLTMFLAEALIVAVFAGISWLLAVLILAIL